VKEVKGGVAAKIDASVGFKNEGIVWISLGHCFLTLKAFGLQFLA